MSWRIFLHSVRQVFGNLGGALRVSGLLTLAQFAIMLTIGQSLLLDQESRQQMIVSGQMPWGKFVLALLLVTALWLWIAVGWHRYILLNEKPSLVPPLRVDRMLGYFGKSLLIGLILIIPALILGFVGGGLMTVILKSGSGIVAAFFLMAIIVYVPLATIGMRLCAMLPGAALEPGVPVFSGWEATRGATLTILGVVVISVVCSLALNFLGLRLFSDPFGLPSRIYELVVQWIVTMVGVSILTTLYGHYVEKRPLV